MYPEDPEAWAKVCPENIFGNNSPSTTSASLAFRLVHASQLRVVSHQDMADVIAQIAFDSKRMQLLSQGCDFFGNNYQAEVSSSTGHLLVDHEDYIQVKELCLPITSTVWYCGDDGGLPGLLSLRHILDTIQESPSLRYLAAALPKIGDSQNSLAWAARWSHSLLPERTHKVTRWTLPSPQAISSSSQQVPIGMWPCAHARGQLTRVLVRASDYSTGQKFEKPSHHFSRPQPRHRGHDRDTRPLADSAMTDSESAMPAGLDSSGEVDGKAEHQHHVEDEEDVCRICRTEAEEDNPLCYPCACSGSIKHVHQECLEKWLKMSGRTFCEV
eukprot:gene32261-16827_t